MGRNRRKFTPEFKAEAVALVEASGGNIAAVAKELGIYDSSLGNWVREARGQAEGAPSPDPSGAQTAASSTGRSSPLALLIKIAAMSAASTIAIAPTINPAL